jgi:dTMP kinase
MSAGQFITFEGGEGTGKSTQTRLLAQRLRERALDVVVTREPGGSPFAEEIRALLLNRHVTAASQLAEALLFYSARVDHVAATIAPALAAGSWVICDRFADSTRVYQGVAGGLGLDRIERIESMVLDGLTPDLTLLIDLDPKEGMERARERARRNGNVEADRYEARDIAYHETLRQGFLDIAAREPQRCRVIDGSGTIDAVAARIWKAVAQRYAWPVV